ncbi:MAG: YbdK family carboxylate-amine ligase [Burkholderiales bacterium]|jgi:carboxylate-amine ligase|nr:YbdK family carboxylate-amine ligase [Burkholderiales bacterium]
MSLEPFAPSRALTLGVELELQIVNTHDHDLAPHAPDLLRVLRGVALPGDIKPEVTRSMVELSTGICDDHRAVLAQLRTLRDALVDAARRLEIGLCGGGTHPFQHWKRQRIYAEPRFRQVSALYGYLARQFTVFGQHVHVGCPSGDDALLLLHGLARWMPHLIALAAASPFVQGEDTAFDSARLNSVAAFPLAGRAPFVTTWRDFEAYFDRMARTGIVSSMKDFYWDIRPKPEFGTIEVRVLDTPLTIDKAAALAALIQCIAAWLRAERPYVPGEDDALVYGFNRFQACRFGLDGLCVDPTDGAQRTMRADLLALFARIEGHAIDRHAEPAIALLRQSLQEDGNDATWLRRTYDRERQLAEVVRLQVARWAATDT